MAHHNAHTSSIHQSKTIQHLVRTSESVYLPRTTPLGSLAIVYVLMSAATLVCSEYIARQ